MSLLHIVYGTKVYINMELRSLLLTGLVLGLTVQLAQCVCSDKDLTAVETLTVTEQRQEYTTPNYPLYYYTKMNCQWIFDVGQTGMIIVMDVTDVNFESSTNCVYDSLSIYEGENTNSPLLEKLCGTTTGKFVTIEGRHGMVRMSTDRRGTKPGAKMYYFFATDQSGTGCSSAPAQITASTNDGYITSPGFPLSTLTGDLNCQWLITSGAGTTVYVKIIYLDLENTPGCDQQNLILYDGSSTTSTQLTSTCSDRLAFAAQSPEFITSGNTALLTLVTSSSATTRQGFKVTYRQEGTAATLPPTTTIITTETLAVCSSTPTELTVSDSWQTFTSINYPEYYVNFLNCYWILEATVGSNINLTFQDSLMEGGACTAGDYVSVHDGNTASHTRLTIFCGDEKPVIISSSRFLYIHFHTDDALTYRGFSANYKSITADVPDCATYSLSGDFTASSTEQEFTSAGFPNGYDHGQTVYWRIHNPNETQGIFLVVHPESRLEYSLNCQYDNVKIYQGVCDTSPLLGQFCGPIRPTYIHNHGPYALIVFTTDTSVNYTGFKLTFYLDDLVTPTDDSGPAVEPVVIAVVVIIVSVVVAVVASIIIWKKTSLCVKGNGSSGPTSGYVGPIPEVIEPGTTNVTGRQPLPPIGENLYPH